MAKGTKPMKFNEFTDYVDYLCEHEIPQEIFNGLNLGVVVSPDRQVDDEEKDFYIMGEYIQDALGCQVVLYYGTFKYFFKGEPLKDWQDEILSTLKHELLHHIEALAGQEDLAVMEEMEVRTRKQEKKKKHS